jgi:manganese transport protein
MIYLGAGILGATIMPHNLFLHSSLARPAETLGGESRRSVLRASTAGTVATLSSATAVNAGLLILAGTLFHSGGSDIAVGITDAYKLMPSALGLGFASTLFGLGLWLASLSASVTSAMAGEIVLKGFGVVRVSPTRLRSISRIVAVVPALAVSCVAGPQGVSAVLVLSQVVLSLQLPFVAIPLLNMTANPRVMGGMGNKFGTQVAGWALMAAIVVSDVILVASFFA